MVGIILGKKHCQGTNKEGQGYNYDHIVYGLADDEGVGITCDFVNLDHAPENGLLPLFEPVEVHVGVKYGKFKVVGFTSNPKEVNPLIESIVAGMRSGGYGMFQGDEWGG